MTKYAGVYSYATKKGVRWKFTYDEPGTYGPAGERVRRKRVVGGFTTAKAAATARRQRLDELDGKPAEQIVAASKQTLGEYLLRTFLPWVDSPAGHLDRKEGSIEQLRLFVSRIAAHPIAAVPLQTLRAADLEALYVELRTAGWPDRRTPRPLAAKTVKNVSANVSLALRMAVERRLVETNVARDARLPRLPRADEKSLPYDEHELRTALDVLARDPLFALWRLYIVTGMRRGEALGLRWHDLDLDGGRIVVRRSVVRGRRVETPKTANSLRTIALDTETVEVLRAWRQAQTVRSLDGWVFTDEHGGVYEPNTVARAFQALLRGAGLRPTTIRDLRHAHATALMHAGVPMKVIQERLGHANISITMDVYSHVAPRADEEAARTIGQILGA